MILLLLYLPHWTYKKSGAVFLRDKPIVSNQRKGGEELEQIELIRAKPEDAALVHALQLEAFWPLYQIYQDDETSPAKESTERILEKITDPDGDGQLSRNRYLET